MKDIWGRSGPNVHSGANSQPGAVTLAKLNTCVKEKNDAYVAVHCILGYLLSCIIESGAD